MSLPNVATRDEWLKARTELLRAEKKMTEQRDRLSTQRRNLPMVAITKDYEFEGPDGVSLRRHVRGPQAADDLPLHVRSRLGRRVPELHGGDRRDVARADGPSPHA